MNAFAAIFQQTVIPRDNNVDKIDFMVSDNCREFVPSTSVSLAPCSSIVIQHKIDYTHVRNGGSPGFCEGKSPSRLQKKAFGAQGGGSSLEGKWV